jgi:hypothetical protein
MLLLLGLLLRLLGLLLLRLSLLRLLLLLLLPWLLDTFVDDGRGGEGKAGQGEQKKCVALRQSLPSFFVENVISCVDLIGGEEPNHTYANGLTIQHNV